MNMMKDDYRSEFDAREAMWQSAQRPPRRAEPIQNAGMSPTCTRLLFGVAVLVGLFAAAVIFG